MQSPQIQLSPIAAAFANGRNMTQLLEVHLDGFGEKQLLGNGWDNHSRQLKASPLLAGSASAETSGFASHVDIIEVGCQVEIRSGSSVMVSGEASATLLDRIGATASASFVRNMSSSTTGLTYIAAIKVRCISGRTMKSELSDYAKGFLLPSATMSREFVETFGDHVIGSVQYAYVVALAIRFSSKELLNNNDLRIKLEGSLPLVIAQLRVSGDFQWASYGFKKEVSVQVHSFLDGVVLSDLGGPAVEKPSDIARCLNHFEKLKGKAYAGEIKGSLAIGWASPYSTYQIGVLPGDSMESAVSLVDTICPVVGADRNSVHSAINRIKVGVGTLVNVCAGFFQIFNNLVEAIKRKPSSDLDYGLVVDILFAAHAVLSASDRETLVQMVNAKGIGTFGHVMQLAETIDQPKAMYVKGHPDRRHYLNWTSGIFHHQVTIKLKNQDPDEDAQWSLATEKTDTGLRFKIHMISKWTRYLGFRDDEFHASPQREYRDPMLTKWVLIPNPDGHTFRVRNEGANGVISEVGKRDRDYIHLGVLGKPIDFEFRPV